MPPIYIITNITWASGTPYFANVLTEWEVQGSKPADSKIFYQTTRYHVAPLNSTSMPCVQLPFAHIYHLIIQSTLSMSVLPRVGSYPFHVNLYELYSQQIFASLEKRTEHDISLIRCLFEPIQSALGSWWWGLCTCLFWGDSEHFDFWAKFWPLV